MSFLSRFFKPKKTQADEPVGPLHEQPELKEEPGVAASETSDQSEDSRLGNGKRWIGIDLDGTLAYYDGWKGFEHIGKPIPEMVLRVREWMNQGFGVRIFTARASMPQGIQPVKDWLKEHDLPELEVTCTKDFDMIECWDDRGVQVVPNTGQPVLSARYGALPRAPLFGIEHQAEAAMAMHRKQGTEPRPPAVPAKKKPAAPPEEK